MVNKLEVRIVRGVQRWVVRRVDDNPLIDKLLKATRAKKPDTLPLHGAIPQDQPKPPSR